MSFADATCDHCNNKITGCSVFVTVKSPERPDYSLYLCGDCFLTSIDRETFVDLVKGSKQKKLGPVEQVAKREDKKELGPVERVARREDSK